MDPTKLLGLSPADRRQMFNPLAAPVIARHPQNRALNRKVLTLLIAKELRRMRNRNSRAWLGEKTIYSGERSRRQRE